MINKEFKSKTHEQRREECSLKRFQTKEGKWNLQNKKTGEFISDIWFDNLGTWGSFSCIVGREHDIFGRTKISKRCISIFCESKVLSL